MRGVHDAAKERSIPLKVYMVWRFQAPELYRSRTSSDPEDLVSHQSIPGAFQTHTQYIDGEGSPERDAPGVR